MTDQEIIDFVRWWLGDLPTSVISDVNMQLLLDMVNLQYPTANDCQKKFYLAKAVLEFLIRQDAQGSAGSAGSGAVKKTVEQEGNIRYETEYDVGTSSGEASGWDKVLEDLLNNPSSIGCDPIDSSTGTTPTGSLIIGGSDINGTDRVFVSRQKMGQSIYDYRSNVGRRLF